MVPPSFPGLPGWPVAPASAVIEFSSNDKIEPPAPFMFSKKMLMVLPLVIIFAPFFSSRLFKYKAYVLGIAFGGNVKMAESKTRLGLSDVLACCVEDSPGSGAVILGGNSTLDIDRALISTGVDGVRLIGGLFCSVARRLPTSSGNGIGYLKNVQVVTSEHHTIIRSVTNHTITSAGPSTFTAEFSDLLLSAMRASK